MAFLNKLNELARTAGEKTSNAIETGKLTLKISSEEKKISAATLKLGELLLAKLDAGDTADEEVMKVYSEIMASRELIAEVQEEIEGIKAPKETAEAAPAAEEAPAEAPAAEGETKFCSSCGAKLSASARFCPECGSAQ